MLATCLLAIAFFSFDAHAHTNAASDDVLAIGFIAPLPIQRAATFDPYREVSQAALQGLLMAADDAGRLGLGEVKVYVANAPTPEATVRAVHRLVELDGVDVIVGGFGSEQAEALIDAATQIGVTVINAGSSDPRLRMCREGVVHLEAALDEYVWAALSSTQVGRIALVYDRTLAEAIADIEVTAQEALEGASLVSLPVAPDTLVWNRTIKDLVASQAEAVVLVLPQLATESFIEQADGRLSVPVTVVPTLSMQTWSAFAAHAEASELEVSRVVLWSPGVSDLAEDIGIRYASRWGVAMDSAGWVGYQAAFAAVGLDFGAGVEVGGAAAGSMSGIFSPDDLLPNGQVNQTLYRLVLDGTATWSPSPYDQMALASDVKAVGRPAASSAWLRRYTCE